MIAASALAETDAHVVAQDRLLHVDRAAGAVRDRRIDDLPALLRRGDLLVVNDAATLPASLGGHAGTPIEVRLCGESPSGTWRAVLFGAGDWRTPTEHRPPPPALPAGARIVFARDLAATIESSSAISPRLVELRFDRRGDVLWSALYRHGRPVQYAYEPEPLPLARVQTPYASRPWAAEMPSAGRPLRPSRLSALARHGVRIVWLTHAAGLSSTGDPALDAALPLPERYDIPASTATAIGETRAAGNRVIAVGTSVVRALEGSAREHDGAPAAGAGETDLVITRRHRPRVIGGLLSGIHAPDSSHFALLGAFLSPPLEAIYVAHVAAAGYRGHEFGDSTLIL
jgi:S-adenosylmethionine:tRNA ribosyltransferase-isomerase